MQQHLRDSCVLNKLIHALETKDPNASVFFEDKELLQLIQYYHSQCDYQMALSVVDMGLDHYGFNADFYLAQAKLFVDMNEYEQALASIELGLNISPNDVELSILRCYALIDLQEYDLADSELTDLYNRVQRPGRIDILLCRAHYFEKVKSFSEMFDTLYEAVMINPEDCRTLERMFVAIELCRNYDDSIAIHSDLIELNPYNARAWYNLGHAYGCIGEYHDSIMALEYAFLIDASFETAYRDCADMAMQVGRYRHALQIYLEAIDSFGPELELLLNAGRCYLELGQHEQARIHLQQAVSMDPYDDEGHYFLGRSHFQNGAFEEAIACYSEAIRIEDEREEYYDDLAKSYHLIGEYTLANHYFEKATEIGAPEVSYWFHHVVFLLDIGAIDRAEEVLKNSELHTYGPELLYAKSAIQFLREDKKGGIELLTEAVEEDASVLSSFFTLFPAGKVDQDIQSLIIYYTC